MKIPLTYPEMEKRLNTPISTKEREVEDLKAVQKDLMKFAEFYYDTFIHLIDRDKYPDILDKSPREWVSGTQFYNSL